LIKEREPGYQNHMLRSIVQETCALGGGCTLSALKDFLVPSGGLILKRATEALSKAACRRLSDARNVGGAMELWRRRCAIFLPRLIRDRPSRQVNYLWRRLNGGVPLINPPPVMRSLSMSKHFCRI